MAPEAAPKAIEFAEDEESFFAFIGGTTTNMIDYGLVNHRDLLLTFEQRYKERVSDFNDGNPEIGNRTLLQDIAFAHDNMPHYLSNSARSVLYEWLEKNDLASRSLIMYKLLKPEIDAIVEEIKEDKLRELEAMELQLGHRDEEGRDYAKKHDCQAVVAVNIFLEFSKFAKTHHQRMPKVKDETREQRIARCLSIFIPISGISERLRDLRQIPQNLILSSAREILQWAKVKQRSMGVMTQGKLDGETKTLKEKQGTIFSSKESDLAGIDKERGSVSVDTKPKFLPADTEAITASISQPQILGNECTAIQTSVQKIEEDSEDDEEGGVPILET